MESIRQILEGMKMGNVVPLVQFPERELDRFYGLSYELDRYEPSVSVVPEYYRFREPGERVRGVFLGFRTIEKRNDRNQLVAFECVLWMRSGQLFMNGSKMLVNALREARLSIGTTIEMVLMESGKRYQLFEVRLMEVKSTSRKR